MFCLSVFATPFLAQANARDAKPDKKPQETSRPAETDKNAAQIELLETKYRFETNGDSRKEVYARVKINNELGVRQFARLNFDFNRGFQSIEIPLLRITHASGGLADILPSAIADNPNPAVVDAPGYQDVRVKSVRILGLQPGDQLEYRVITTTTHHPLAPEFWCEHTFNRSGIVTKEIFELDLPSPRKLDMRVNPETPASATLNSGEASASRIRYRWDRPTTSSSPKQSSSAGGEASQIAPDVIVSTEAWEMLSIQLDEKLTPGSQSGRTSDANILRKTDRELDFITAEIKAKALELTEPVTTGRKKLEALYEFVSQKITTVDLPLGSTAFVARQPNEILTSGYATPEDKFVLLAALAAPLKFGVKAALTGSCDKKAPARPSIFTHLLVSAHDGATGYWLDPALEVAPFGVILPNSGKCAFVLNRIFHSTNSTSHEWQSLKGEPPFPSIQKVSVDANLKPAGSLTAHVHYALRGDNELLLRVAFHKTPKDKWKDVAQLLAISDGFRGEITGVNASDPYQTKEPFIVEYEISQPEFVNWAKKPVRIPALLPSPGLPEPQSAASLASSATTSIDLGTPLEVELDATVQLPEGTTAVAPIGTSVERDYATFSSKYNFIRNVHPKAASVITASRRLRFISREIPPTRAGDLNAFLHAVQSDQTQLFTLQPASPK
jgi:hypothetical protein